MITLPLPPRAAATLVARAVLRRLGDFDEAKHPRDDHGKFTDGGGEGGSAGGEKPKKEKAAPATKDQAKLAHEMKMAGHSYAEISKATGLNEKQAATIVFKINKKAKEEKAALLGTKQEAAKPATAPVAKAPPAPAAAPSGAGTGLLTAKATSNGYTWQEKTAANSPNIQAGNTGKYAWFKDGTQVSPPAAKGESESAAAQMHFGKGPKSKEDAAKEAAQAQAAHAAAAKTFAQVNPHEPGGAAGHVSAWPISDSQVRQLGANYPKVVEQAGHAWAAKLTSAENEAVQSYTGSGYGHINEALRGKVASISPGTKAKIDHIDSALKKAPAPPPPELVWRGIGGAHPEAYAMSLKPGDKITMAGFQSTSIRPDFAATWGGSKVVFEIKPRAGAYVRPISQHKAEYEFLMPHNGKYAVVGHASVKLGHVQRTVVKLEHIG